MTEYSFAQSDARGRERLAGIAAAMDPGTFALLEELGIAEGDYCAEVGAGAGTVIDWLVTRVGDDGSVVATDIDTRWLEGRGWPNVDVRVHDIAMEPLDNEAFDLVHTRTVLTHLRDWQSAIDHLIGATRPGGTVLVEETDMSPLGRCYPEEPAVDRFCRGLEALIRFGGGDPHLGLRLPKALREAGLSDVSYQVRLLPADGPTMRLQLDAAAERLMAIGQLSPEDVERAAAFYADPDNVLYGTAIVAAWGRRPR